MLGITELQYIHGYKRYETRSLCKPCRRSQVNRPPTFIIRGGLARKRNRFHRPFRFLRVDANFQLWWKKRLSRDLTWKYAKYILACSTCYVCSAAECVSLIGIGSRMAHSKVTPVLFLFVWNLLVVQSKIDPHSPVENTWVIYFRTLDSDSKPLSDGSDSSHDSPL